MLNPLVLAAAQIAGVDEIYRIGGAQAIAALAYGTATIAPVDKIIGPGNAYVAAAKRRVFGTVGIDMIAGPSEILVVADGNNDPPGSPPICWRRPSTTRRRNRSSSPTIAALPARCATRVDAPARAAAARRDRRARAGEDHGAIILVRDLGEAPALVDRIARRACRTRGRSSPRRWPRSIRNAGAIFLGRHTPEAVGDYVAGPNHVLPTARSARFSSGLGVLDFMKRTSILRCDAASLKRDRPGGDHARPKPKGSTRMRARSRSGSISARG